MYKNCQLHINFIICKITRDDTCFIYVMPSVIKNHSNCAVCVNACTILQKDPCNNNHRFSLKNRKWREKKLNFTTLIKMFAKR